MQEASKYISNILFHITYEKMSRKVSVNVENTAESQKEQTLLSRSCFQGTTEPVRMKRVSERSITVGEHGVGERSATCRWTLSEN